MNPLRIDSANMLMRGPDGNASFIDLHVRMLKAPDGNTYYISRWEPTPEELSQLNAGDSVELWCQHHQVPVALKTAPHVEAGS